jgi:hypothetical protein
MKKKIFGHVFRPTDVDEWQNKPSFPPWASDVFFVISSRFRQNIFEQKHRKQMNPRTGTFLRRNQ